MNISEPVRASVTGLVIAGLALSAGCTSSSSSGPTSAPTGTASSNSPSSTRTAPKTTITTPYVQPSNLPKSVPNQKGVIKNRLVTITSCTRTADGWKAIGSARGKAGAKADYTITVYFTTNAATVEAFGRTKVSVAKGKTGAWTVTKNFKATAGTLCVLRGAG